MLTVKDSELQKDPEVQRWLAQCNEILETYSNEIAAKSLAQMIEANTSLRSYIDNLAKDLQP